jgi:nucleoside-diphosphate-sugar epimerase
LHEYPLLKQPNVHPEGFMLSNNNGDDKIKSILVTGGAGYIGSILIRKLLNAGYQITCLDNLRYGGRSLIDAWDHPDFTFKKVDITDWPAVDAVLAESKFDAVVHLAAIVGDPACKLEPDLAIRTNREASIHLLEKSIENKISRFIFASTCSNYGKMKDSESYVDETSTLAPISLYAQLKVEFEDLILNRIEKQDDFSPTALRFATVFGMSPRMRFDLTVNEFTKEVALDRELVVYGEQFWRPYCHVSDFSRAIMAVLHARREKVAYNVFNVGDTSQNYTKKMIVEQLQKLVPEARVRYVKKDEDPRDYRVKFDKIQRELDFRISKTVPQGIQDILTAIQNGVIENPDEQRFYNIPIKR